MCGYIVGQGKAPCTAGRLAAGRTQSSTAAQTYLKPAPEGSYCYSPSDTALLSLYIAIDQDIAAYGKNYSLLPYHTACWGRPAYSWRVSSGAEDTVAQKSALSGGGSPVVLTVYLINVGDPTSIGSRE